MRIRWRVLKRKKKTKSSHSSTQAKCPNTTRDLSSFCQIKSFIWFTDSILLAQNSSLLLSPFSQSFFLFNSLHIPPINSTTCNLIPSTHCRSDNLSTTAKKKMENNNVLRNNKTMVFLMIMSIILAANIFHGECYSLCNMTDDGLQACKPSVTLPNPVDPPTAACCTALSTADLPCLCSQKGSPMLTFLGIDPALAMALPNKCNLTPPTNC